MFKIEDVVRVVDAPLKGLIGKQGKIMQVHPASTSGMMPVELFGSAQLWWFLPGELELVSPFINLNSTPPVQTKVCDCGGATARTGHAHWCSTERVA